MADNERHPFGGGIGDYVVEVGDSGLAVFAPGAVIEFFNARDGGAKYTDITEDKAGTIPLGTVVSQDGGPGSGYAMGDYPTLHGPPGVRFMWASADGGPRKLIFANDLAEDVGLAVSASVIASLGDLLVGTGLGQVDRLGAGANGQVLTVDPTAATGLRWKTPAAGGGGGGGVATTSDTLWVAASDAPDQFADAPYQCDGTADQTEINAAIANAFGLRVGLSPGTFNLSGRIQLLGVDNVDAEVTRSLRGSGAYVTNLVLGAGVEGAIFLGQAVCPHVSDLRITVPSGAGHGIYSARSAGVNAGNRSFWHGSIKNVQVAGPWNGTHTGWGLSLGSGFRYVVENVEVSGCGNGIRVLNESAAFNCGDAVFNRCFVEVIGTNATAYHVSSPTGNANQIAFITCHGIADPASTGTVMWKFDGAGSTSHIRVINSNAEQFDTTVTIASTAFDIDVDLVHVTHAGGTFAAVAGYSSRISVGLLYVASGAVAALTETNGYAAKPNEYRFDIYAEAGTTVTATLLTGVILKGNTDGPGVIAGILKQKQARGRTFTFTRTGAPAVAVGRYPIFNNTGNDLVLRAAQPYLDTGYTAGSLIVDININGVSIFPGGTNRPTIAPNTKTPGRLTTGIAGVVWPAGQAMTVDVDQIGTAGTAAELTVQVDTFN